MVDFRIHNKNHIVKSALGHFESLFNKHSSNELVVVNYHGTPKKFIEKFKSQMAFFKSHFNVISPADFRNYYVGNYQSDRASLIITLDDGIKNNLLAADVLNELDIKAFFFVIPDFINTARGNQKKYFIDKIRPEINPYVDSLSEDFEAMSWKEIKNILNEGHAIGSHTSSHTLVARESSIENSIYEIKTSKEMIARELDIVSGQIDTFCSINNTLLSTQKEEARLIRENYKFHFTTFPGSNMDKNPLFVKRSNIESHWTTGAIKYAIGLWDRKRWRPEISSYEELIS